MTKKKKAVKKTAPPAMSDETAKLIADTAVNIVDWVRATPARTAGALLVVGLSAAFVGSLLPPSRSDK